MTLKCITGIVKPDKGHIELNGRVLFDSDKKIDLPPQKRKVGYLFQQYALFPHMTVEQNIRAGAHARPKAEREQAVREVLHAFRLEGLENNRPSQLSGGQQQRCALARILVGQPELVLLDEPFSALDAYLKWQVELELADILKNLSCGTLFVTHNRDEVYRLCDTVCVLNKGKSDPKETVKELFRAPATMGAALISGCKNVSAAEVKQGETLFCKDWNVTLKTALTRAGRHRLRRAFGRITSPQRARRTPFRARWSAWSRTRFRPWSCCRRQAQAGCGGSWIRRSGRRFPARKS